MTQLCYSQSVSSRYLPQYNKCICDIPLFGQRGLSWLLRFLSHLASRQEDGNGRLWEAKRTPCGEVGKSMPWPRASRGQGPEGNLLSCAPGTVFLPLSSRARSIPSHCTFLTRPSSPNPACHSCNATLLRGSAVPSISYRFQKAR